MKKNAKKEAKVELSLEEHKKLLSELEEYKDKYLRIVAEFDNARKRMDKERVEFVKYANERLIADFLDILDDLERSVQAASTKHEDYDAFLKGIELVMGRIHEILKKNGVKPIEAGGKIFDPHFHEVLLQEDNNDVEEDTVLEELQKGYLINDKVVRTAKVKLAKHNKE